MTVIDTAEMYGEGGAEKVVARAIAGRRDDVFVVSKVYPHNAGAKSAIAACERSLVRLATDRLDLYLLHWRGTHSAGGDDRRVRALARIGQDRALGCFQFRSRRHGGTAGASRRRALCNQSGALQSFGARDRVAIYFRYCAQACDTGDGVFADRTGRAADPPKIGNSCRAPRRHACATRVGVDASASACSFHSAIIQSRALDDNRVGRRLSDCRPRHFARSMPCFRRRVAGPRCKCFSASPTIAAKSWRQTDLFHTSKKNTQ